MGEDWTACYAKSCGMEQVRKGGPAGLGSSAGSLGRSLGDVPEYALALAVLGHYVYQRDRMVYVWAPMCDLPKDMCCIVNCLLGAGLGKELCVSYAFPGLGGQ